MMCLQTYNKLNNEIVFTQFRYDEASNELFSLNHKAYNLNDKLKIKNLFEQKDFTPSSDVLRLSHKSNFLFVKNEQMVLFVEPETCQILYSLATDQLNISSRILSIKHTDDFVCLGADLELQRAVLIYLEFFKDIKNNYRLRVFKHSRTFLMLKVHSNLISTVEHYYEIFEGKLAKTETSFNVYDAFKVKETGSFATCLFKIELTQNLNDFDYTEDCQYLAMAHASYIALYRVCDSTLMAKVPSHNIASLVVFTETTLLVALYLTGEIVSYSLSDKTTSKLAQEDSMLDFFIDVKKID